MLNGGGGDRDRAVYWDATRGITADLQNRSANTGEAKGDRYFGIEGLDGSRFNDILRGDGRDNRLNGDNGNDRLEGRGGDDELFGQNGNDKLFGGAGNDYLNGGNGADVLNGGAGDRDQAVYWDAARGVTADLQNRSANTGEAKGDRYFGVEGFWGSRFNDVLRGNGGDNELGGDNGNDRLEGRGGDDFLFGNNGNDKLFGGGGDDYLNGGTGADVLNGGAGDDDRAAYWNSARAITADLQNRSANTGEAKGDRYFGIEGLDGSRFNDILRGNGGDNRIFANDGNDRLEGRGGDDELFGQNGNDKLFGGGGDNDRLNGGAGADVLNGGGGDNDQAVYWDAARGVTADLQNRGANTGEAKGDSYFGVEGLWGSRFNDVLRGNGGDNELGGNSGNDRLEGRGGDDKLFGQNGNDTLFGGGGDDGLFGQNGNDKLFGGNGEDRLNGGAGADVLNGGAGDDDRAAYWDAAKGVTADLQNRSANTGEAKGDRYFGIEGLDGSRFNDVLRGNGGDNRIFANDGNDRLEGRGGDDELFGQNGNDKLFGGDGEDRLNGGAGADVLDGGAGDRDQAVYWDSESGITADLQNSSANTGEAAGDVYIGIEGLNGSHQDDFLFGDGTGNRIWGDEGDDVINGRGGDDVLGGAEGRDILTGGDGADGFAFWAPLTAGNADTITDFSVDDDMFYLDRKVFSGLAEGVLAASAFSGSGAATGSGAAVVYDSGTGEVSYDSDGAGGADARLFATITAGLALTAAEFEIYA